LKVNIKLLSDKAVVPFKAHESDAGFDLTAISQTMDDLGNMVFDTGIALELPPNYMGLVFPRSSISKTTLDLANSVGVIDPDYRGAILVKFKPAPYFEMRDENKPQDYQVGDRIAQLIIIPFPQIQLNVVDSFSETQRGEGGFGSTN